MTPCGLEPCDFIDVSYPYYYAYAYEAPSTETTYGITVSLGNYPETALERAVGCILVSAMPEEGLEETLYSLKDLLEFYMRRIEHVPTPRQIPERINTTIVGEKKRRDLVITE